MRRAIAGFCGLIAAAMAPAAQAAAPQLAITFDDLPAHASLPPGQTRLAVAQTIIAALKAAGAPEVYGFVNGVHVQEDADSAAVLPAWRAAGFPLGNHGWSHLNLNTVGVAAFEADVVKNEAVLEAQAGGADWRWLRYPFLAEGATPEDRTEVRRFLASHGYRIADVTMSFADYAFNDPYARCAAKGDAAAVARLEQAYLAGAAAEAERSRVVAHAAAGRDVPYVLLMHIGAFDARMIARLLDQYRTEGFEFVTLPQAEADPAYAADLDPASAAPTASAAGWAAAARAPGIPAKPDLAWLDALCR